MNRQASVLITALSLSVCVPAAFGQDLQQQVTQLSRDFRTAADAGRYSEAEEAAGRLLQLAERNTASQPKLLGNLLYQLGVYYYSNGRYREALPYMERNARLEQQKSEQSSGFAWASNNLALDLQALGRWETSEQNFRRALQAFQASEGPESAEVAAALHNLGNLCRAQGRFLEAESFLKRALALRKTKFGERHQRVAESLDDLGRVYRFQHQLAESEKLTLQARDLFHELAPETTSEAMCLNNLAAIRREQGRFAEAEKLHEQGLAIWKNKFGALNHDVGMNHCYLASVCLMQQRLDAAAEHAEEALRTFEQVLGKDHNDLRIPLGLLAEIRHRQGNLTSARAAADREVQIVTAASGSPTDRCEALQRRALIDWQRDARDSAMADMRQAMNFVDQQRGLSSGTDQDRALFFTRFADVYETMFRWQVELNDAAGAFATLERSRARVLNELLFNHAADLLSDVPANESRALLQRDRDARNRVSELQSALNALGRQSQLSAANKQREYDSLLRELTTAQAAALEAFRDLQNASRLARLGRAADGRVATLSDVRDWATANKGLVLAYLIGRQNCFVMAISAAGESTIEPLKLSDDQARRLNQEAGALTSERLQSLLMNAEKTGVLQRLADPSTAQQAAGQLAALWTVLVPQAQREQLQNSEFQNVVILPDGPLSCLPFETLVTNTSDTPTYLLDVAPPIQYAPSATVLFNLQQRVAANADPTLKPVLAVGNAQYGPERSMTGDSLALLTTGARYVKQGGHLQPLPYSGTEVTWVSDGFGKQGIAVGKLLQADATEAKIRYNVPGRRIVHFACHGLVDQEHGNFFGSLAVTPGPKAVTDPADDGFLTLAEIYQLDFKSCELAILSACNTNFGPYQRGEGTWALSRGFLIAGTRRVAASNWLVDDEAAASLISYFTGGIARDLAKSATPNYAKRLYEARKWVREQDKWSSPYYWGGFVLVGPQ